MMTALSAPLTTSGSAAPGAGRPATLSAVAWTPNRDLDYRVWMIEGQRIGTMWRASPWWIGDWLSYGTARWGEQYVEAAKLTGYDPKSLRNIRYISSRFQLSLRRDNLTWSHHALLAGLDHDEQQRWLDRATLDHFSVEDLRIELRSEERGSYSRPTSSEHQSEDPAPTVVICPRCGGEVTIPEHPTR
jgi:hypothetical protein